MASIDLLEERVTELENRIIGLNKIPAPQELALDNSIIDKLLHINNQVNSALSGREKTTNLVKRLPELNEMLGPVYNEVELNSDAKLELILAMEQEIKDYAKSMEQLEELQPVLKIDSMRDIPELLPKLSQLTMNFNEFHEKSDTLSQSMWATFEEYNDVITNIARILISLNSAVTAAETAALPKKQLD